MSNDKPLVGIILGSKSDAPDFEGCKEMLEKFGVPYEFVIHSAHRNPDDVREWAVSAESRGLRVIIAGAGKAAALGGVVASHTPLPVIAVPMKTSDLGGMDSLLSTVQCPRVCPWPALPSMAPRTRRFWQPRSWAPRYPSTAMPSSRTSGSLPERKGR